MESVISEVPAPSVEMIEEQGTRLVALDVITQHVDAQAFGSPSAARRLGASAVDEHDDALRRLADS
jgi:hypothetical protein